VNLRLFVRFAVTLCLYFFALSSPAAYPEKPIRLVVPFSAGGNTDIFARTIAPKITEAWGQQVIVDNRGGAGGTIGTEIVSRATPDGYTLLFVSGSHVINPNLYRHLPYDTVRDFAPVSLVVDVPSLLVAHPSVPARTVPEMIKLAKASPGKYNYGSSGTGTFAHLAFEMFNSMAGVQIQHIPYKGNAPATADLLGGQVQFMLGAQPAAMPHVRAKRLIPIGITSKTRSSLLPDVASISEFLPGYEFNQGFGILAPAGTPSGVIQKVNTKIVQVLDMPEVSKAFLNLGAVPAGNSPAEYAEYLRVEMAKLAKVARQAGVVRN